MKALFSVFVAFFLLTSCQNQIGGGEPKITVTGFAGDFETAVLLAMQEQGVAGLSVAIVRGGKTVYARGFGSRTLESDKAVTADTLFAIGSTTKAFTAAAAGTLIDEKKLEWDRKVKEVIPDFKLEDASITEQVTLRDLLLHRTGLPRHDMVWYGSSETRDELLKRVAFLPASEPFRTKWQYQNLMYMVAGISLERVEGRSWEKIVKARLLSPLQMRRTVFSHLDAIDDGDVAYPYALAEGKLFRIPFRNIDAIGPAGSIFSSANEMGNWLSCLMAKGTFQGRTVLSPETFQELTKPQMEIPPLIGSGVAGDFKDLGYAFGWMVTEYRGRRLVWHSGGIDGFRAFIGFFPDSDLGIVALANVGHFDPAAAAFYAADKILGQEAREWLRKAPVTNPPQATWKVRPLPRPAADYEGTYRHPGYGDIKVTARGEALSWEYHGFTFTLVYTDENKFHLKEGGAGPVFGVPLQFFEGTSGALSGLSWQVEAAVPAQIFQRLAP